MRTKYTCKTCGKLCHASSFEDILKHQKLCNQCLRKTKPMAELKDIFRVKD